MTASPLIAALDTADLAQARAWAHALAPHCAYLKLGLEFFLAHGPHGAAQIPAPIFLDLKLHDIPATVAGAVRAIAPLAPALLTVHAAGGAPMVAAARDAAPAATRILAVTVLTSINAALLAETGVSGGPRQQVLRLAHLALAAGADGLVCSGHEVAPLRDAFGAAPLLVVPGIRPATAAGHDQSRVMTPRDAIAAGADLIVVGRPITQSADPAAAAADILASLA